MTVFPTSAMSDPLTVKRKTPGSSQDNPHGLGIALLIEMAQCGEIDPWDVQVIDVIDRVLAELRARSADATGDGLKETDLSESGQAFLYASMLVLLKADSLLASPEIEEIGEGLDEEIPEGGSDRTFPLKLEQQLRRRAVARPPQQRRVTLQELIEQIQLMSETIAKSPKIKPRRRMSSLSHSKAARAIAQLAHNENLSEVADGLERFLANHWSKMTQGQDWLDLEQLLVSQPQNDRVGVFWALLLLSAQSKVELAQDEFYQDLKIRTLIG